MVVVLPLILGFVVVVVIFAELVVAAELTTEHTIIPSTGSNPFSC
jgi:hypothetical protein